MMVKTKHIGDSCGSETRIAVYIDKKLILTMQWDFDLDAPQNHERAARAALATKGRAQREVWYSITIGDDRLHVPGSFIDCWTL